MNKIKFGTAFFLLIFSAVALSSQDKVDRAIKAVQDLCLSGSEFQMKADAVGNLSLIRLGRGVEANLSVNVREIKGAAAIFDQKIRQIADEDIRRCISPHIKIIIDNILGGQSRPQAREKTLPSVGSNKRKVDPLEKVADKNTPRLSDGSLGVETAQSSKINNDELLRILEKYEISLSQFNYIINNRSILAKAAYEYALGACGDGISDQGGISLINMASILSPNNPVYTPFKLTAALDAKTGKCYVSYRARKWDEASIELSSGPFDQKIIRDGKSYLVRTETSLTSMSCWWRDLAVNGITDKAVCGSGRFGRLEER